MNVTGLGHGSTLLAAANLPFVCVCVNERTLICLLKKERLRKTAYNVAKF